MNSDKIEFLCNELYHGNKIDGRSMRSLQSRGYITNDCKLTDMAKILCGIFENIPSLPYCKISFYDEQISVREYSTCCCGSTEQETFSCTLNAAKLIEEYNQYASFVNSYINSNWDITMDNDPKKWKQFIFNQAKTKYWSENRYTFYIVVGIVTDIMNGKVRGEFTTSEKYSFNDTPSEVEHYSSSLVGNIIYHADIIY
jgi:hypothetical protein